MNLWELNNYNFHDSGIIGITNEENNIKIEIMYCLFMQEDYKEGDPENAKVELIFNDVSYFRCDKDRFDNDEILSVNINNNNVVFVVEDFNHNNYNIDVTADSFDFRIIETIDHID